MRDNLIFIGIHDDDREDCELVLRTFLVKHVQDDSAVNANNNITVDDLYFDRVHSLGGPDRSSTKPRPVIAKFSEP